MEELFSLLLFVGLLFLMMRFGCGSHVRRHSDDKHPGKKADEGAER